MKLTQELRAPHDLNGNPRKLLAVYQTFNAAGSYCDTVAVYELGYGDAPKAVRDLRKLPPMNIPYSEYREYHQSFTVLQP